MLAYNKLGQIVKGMRGSMNRRRGRRPRPHQAKYDVRSATSLDDIDAIIAIDAKMPQEANGFASCNKIGEDLRRFWNRDPEGFYILREKATGDAIGYMDVFGVHGRSNLIPFLIQDGEIGRLDLPSADQIYDAIIPRELWNFDVIDIYIDAIVVKKGHFFGVKALIEYVFDDLATNYPYARISRVATVAVSNKPVVRIDHEDIGSIGRNIAGARLALRAGLTHFRPAGVGHYDDTDGVRYYRLLYILDLSLIRRFESYFKLMLKILPTLIKWIIKSKSGI